MMNQINNDELLLGNNISYSNSEYLIEFDGGTSCNIPRLGYGKGYGSFQVNGGDIYRVEFGMGHSCNSAEILTLCAALQELKIQCPYAENVLCRGDSKIALKWIQYGGKPSKNASDMFIAAINKLRKLVRRFKSVRSQWRGREYSVKLFGH